VLTDLDEVSTMIRTQIQLTEDQLRRLRRRARQDGVSVAEAIRRCIDQALVENALDRAELYRRAAQVIGRFSDSSGANDLSTAHDRYLDEAFS
jgi:hypothetical protein